MRLARWIRIWALQVRAPFLILSVVLVLVGGGIAARDGVFDGLRFALAMIGVALAHVAVNMLNELSDHRTGIDHQTRRTPFSGGSGTLQAGLLTPYAVLKASLGVLATALAIGVFLTCVSGWPLLLFILAGGLATVFYTNFLARYMVGELAAGVCLGTFVVLGTYYAQAETLTAEVAWIAVPPGILTALLLLLNEFPDARADSMGGRRHLVIVLGWRRAAWIYTLALGAAYLVLGIGVLAGLFPLAVLLGLLTLPLGIKAAFTALRHGSKFERMVPALGANVGVVILTDLLIAIAYFIQ